MIKKRLEISEIESGELELRTTVYDDIGEGFEIISTESLLINAGDIVGQRIDIFLAEREEITRSASQKLIENGLVLINGKTVSKNYKFRGNECIEYSIPDPVSMEAKPQDIPLEIVYEDRSVIVVNKPKGMVVHPAPGNPDGTLVNALLYHCGESLSGINGVIRPGIVHRIDRDTSGLLIVAKNDEAHIFLARQIAEHSFDRTYQTVVVGNIKEDCGKVDAPIGRHPTNRKKMAVVSDGRYAVTNYRVLERFGDFTYLELKLETGRTHQIRVHMSKIGHSVLCDPVYAHGSSNKFENSMKDIVRGQCLHAKTIGFIHPESGEHMVFDSELPEYFKTVLKKLRNRQAEL